MRRLLLIFSFLILYVTTFAQSAEYSWDPEIYIQRYRQMFSTGPGTWMGIDSTTDTTANYWRVSTTNENSDYTNSNSDQVVWGDQIWPVYWNKESGGNYSLSWCIDKYDYNEYRDKHTFAGFGEAFGFNPSLPLSYLINDVYIDFRMMLVSQPITSGSSRERAMLGVDAVWNGRDHYLEFNLWRTDNYDNITTTWNEDPSPSGWPWYDDSNGVYDRRGYWSNADVVYYLGNKLNMVPGMYPSDSLPSLTTSLQSYHVNVGRAYRSTVWSDYPSSWSNISLKGVYLGVEVFGAGKINIAFDNLRTYLPYPPKVSVKQKNNQIPTNFSLSQNYPNPFNPSTEIEYSIHNKGLVTLKVYNMLGQEIATLVNQEQNSGVYTVNFDASKLASGVYFYRIQSGEFVLTKKMMFLK